MVDISRLALLRTIGKRMRWRTASCDVRTRRLLLDPGYSSNICDKHLPERELDSVQTIFEEFTHICTFDDTEKAFKYPILINILLVVKFGKSRLHFACDYLVADFMIEKEKADKDSVVGWKEVLLCITDKLIGPWRHRNRANAPRNIHSAYLFGGVSVIICGYLSHDGYCAEDSDWWRVHM